MTLTVIIIIVTCALSLLAFKNMHLLNQLLLWPYQMRNGRGIYRLLTAGFVHADYMHLAFNMFTMYFFGEYLEQYFFGRFGNSYQSMFVSFYLLGIIISCIPSWLKQKNNPNYRSLGASGGVAAVIFAMIYISPWSKIYFFFIPIGIPSIAFAVGYLIYSAYMARAGKGYINHDAHFWGSVFGLLFMVLIDPTHGGSFIETLSHPQF